MKQIILATLLLTFFGCNNNHKTVSQQTNNSIETSKKEDSYTDNAFFNQENGNYHYKNVRYFFDDIGMSPIYLGGLLVKETKEVKGSNQSEGQKTTISLDIMTDEKKLIGDKTFKKDCDEAKLYSHFIETVTFSPHLGGCPHPSNHSR